MPRKSIYDWIARGEIPALRLGKSIRIDESDLARWIDAHREQPE